MNGENLINNSSGIFNEIENKELLDDIMALEAKAEIIFSKMRYGAITENYSNVINLFDDLNSQLTQYWNKYSYLIQNGEKSIRNVSSFH